MDAFSNSDATPGSDLYAGHGYDNHPVQSSEPSRPGIYTGNSSGSGNNDNDHYVPPTKPLRPGMYTAYSNGNSYSGSPQHSMNYMHSSLLPQPSNDNWNAEPSLPTDPATKPLVDSSDVVVPQPLKVQTPNGRLRQRKYQRLKRYLRIGRILTKIITILFSAVMFAIMMFMVIKYQSTKDETRGGRTAWPKDPRLWPTFMLLVGAGLTLLLSFITLLSYCCAFDKARRSWKLTIVRYVIHIGAWVVISTLYRYEKSTHGVDNDLWGWSCSTKAAELQSEFNGVVNFSSLCSVQVRHRHRFVEKHSANVNAVKIMGVLDSGGRGQDFVCNWAFCDLQKDAS